MFKAIVTGYVGQDAEIKYTPSGKAVATFSVATTERFKDKSGNKQERTEWTTFEMWDKLAENLGKHIKQGTLLTVEAGKQTRKWEKDGVTRYSTIFVVRDIELLGGKRPEGAEQAQQGDYTPPLDDDEPAF